MILFCEYFIHPNNDRQREYEYCLIENIKNDNISKIVLLTNGENISLKVSSPKIEVLTFNGNRPTYSDIIEICNNYDDICIISNSDIIFDNTLSIINDDNLKGKLLALTRWDIKSMENIENIEFYNSKMSQDCWIFKPPLILNGDVNFTMGTLGCDNRFANIVKNCGVTVVNPSNQIITKHLHLSNIRNRSENDRIIGDYLYIDPSDDIESDPIYSDNSPKSVIKIVESLWKKNKWNKNK